MNLGEMVTAVLRQFGDPGQAQVDRSDVVRWVNQAQIDIARKTNCVQEHAETNAVAQDGSYELPEDFIAMRRVTFDGKVLPETQIDVADQDHPSRDANATTGTPDRYYIWDYRIYVSPAPSAEGTGNLDIWYVKYPVPLIADEDESQIPDKYHELIVRYCLGRATESDENYNASLAILKEYDTMIMEARGEENNPSSRSYGAVRALPGDDW